MAAPTIKIAILADAADAVSGLKKTGDAADSAADDLKTADKAAANYGEHLDATGSKESQAAGGLGDLGGALAAVAGENSALGRIGGTMETLAPMVMGVTGAADLLALAQNALSLSNIKAAASTVASKAAMVASTVATQAAAAAQWLWNAALSANPIGLIILGVVALVAALVLLWNKSETFRRIVTAAWEGIKTAAVAVFNWISNYLKTVFALYATIFKLGVAAFQKWWSGIKALWTVAVSVFNSVKSAIGSALDWVKSRIAAAIGTVRAAWAGISYLYSKAVEVRNQVIGAFADLARKMYNIGVSIVQGLRDGIAGAWHFVTDKISALVAKIPKVIRDLLGIKSPSKVMLEIGQQTVAGLAKGITPSKQLRSAVGNVAGYITEGLSTTPTVALSAQGAVGTGAAGPVYNITVTGAVDPVETGRQIEKILRRYENSTGRAVLMPS